MLHPRDSFQPMRCLSSLNVNQRSLLLCGIYLDIDGRHLTRQPPVMHRWWTSTFKCSIQTPNAKQRDIEKTNFRAIRSKHSSFSDVKWMKFSYSQERILNEWEVQSLVPIQRGFSFMAILASWISLTNRQQFSMVCTLIDHRNDVKMFRTQLQSWQFLTSISVEVSRKN